jgi:hypothetical protein
MTVLTALAIAEREARDTRIRMLEEALAERKVMHSDALDREAALKAEVARLTAGRQNMPGSEPSAALCLCGRAPDPGVRPEGGCWCLDELRP